MLIEFSLANFLSFKERATLSLEASSDEWLEESHVAPMDDGQRLLKSAAIYGANASGKTNLLEGMKVFRDFILKSSKESQAGEAIDVGPFLLNTVTENAPSHFEIIFAQNNVRYRYGFEADAKIVHAEWLFSQGDSIRETKLFTRERSRIEPSARFKEGKGLEERTRDNALFLSVVSQFNGEISGSVMQWIKRFRDISERDHETYNAYLSFTAHKLKDPAFAERIRRLTINADIGIEDLQMEEISVDRRQKLLPKDASEKFRKIVLDPSNFAFSIRTKHKKFDEDNHRCGSVELDLKRDASAGTQKFVALSGPFLHTLDEGSVLFIDELEARFHPLLTKALVNLFNSAANRKNAQLIYATHDESLLDAKNIRRDQVWFVEKDEFGASKLFSLAEFKVRKEARFAKEYLLGNFGAIPHLDRLQGSLTDAKTKA